MIDLTYALSVPGYTDRGDLTYLATEAERHTSIVEVGAWKGRSTIALAQHTPGQVISIDHWQGSMEHRDDPVYLWHYLEAYTDPYSVYKQYLTNIAPVQSRVLPIIMDSLQVARFLYRWLGPRLDMVFLDGEHDYEGVKADILTWREMLRPGGLLCGHNYDDTWKGVVRAVNELVPEFKIATGTISLWYTII
jgi:predicted O-methyltransferase YrrM